MGNKFMSQLGTSLLLISLVITACTRSRDPKLPDDAAEGTFAISTFNDVADNEKTSYSVKTSTTQRQMDFANQSKASNEKTIVAVDNDGMQVPERIQYMFNNLEVSGQAGKTYGVAFTVDNKSVTAFKVVDNAEDLSLLEKNIAMTRAEISLQKKILMSRGKATQQLFDQLAKAKAARSGALFVPIFKYDVKAFGVLERVKSEIGEETSVLRLKATEWTQATHIQLATTSSDRKLVGVDPNSQDELSRVFVADKINNKIMTYADLNSQIEVGLNLDPKTRVMTLLDADSMKVFEVTQLSKAKLTDAQKEILRTKAKNGQIAECSVEIKKALPVDSQEGCILIQRFNVPVTYVRPELQVVDYNGNRSNTLQFKDLAAGEKSTGLVKIAKNVNPEEVTPTDNLDPRRTLRIVDIKNKEFFFRRTLEDVSAMGTLSGGMAGTMQLVKFSLEDDRLVIKKTQSAISFKKTGAMEDEEVMSLPVSYVKRETKDAAGKNLAVARFKKVTKDEAEYAVIDWTKNEIPVINSPLAFYAEASCFANVNNSQVVDTDMRLTQGILNFSYMYTVTMKPEEGCLNSFNSFGDYDLGGNFAHQFVQKVRERISFKVNDHSTDKNVAPPTPFNVQNALNYGVFTMGFLNPTKNGSYGSEGTQISYPAVHDFTDKNKKYLYTVGGMPSETQDPKRRALLKKIATEVIADWNVAFHKAFDGTPLARSGDYLEVQFAGDNGLEAHLGDLDKNIIWFVDRPMANGLLGVSQAGINPRSGMMGSDSLIVYNGNNAQEVERFKKYYKTLKTFRTGLEKYKKQTLADLNKKLDEEQKDGQKAAADQANAMAPGVGKDVAQKLVSQLIAAKSAPKITDRFTPNFNLNAKSLRIGKVQLDKSRLATEKTAINIPGNDQRYYLDRIFKKAVGLNAADSAGIESLTAKEILASYANKLTAQEKNLLSQKASLMDMQARLQKYFKNNPGCAIRTGDVVGTGEYDKYLETSFEDSFIESTKATLAHEMGHSMGLTHNFIGSYDKANFNFPGEQSNRNYSSVMDYINDTLQHYAGLGPYDVYAIRAAYTGLLELRPEARDPKVLEQGNFKGEIIGGRFVKIEDIKKSYAPTGWANFTGGNGKVIVQQFKYCTDKDLQYEPTCRQFDIGTTPLEIVKNYIQQYEDGYILYRYGYDRLTFDMDNMSSAISRTVTLMLNMRQFLDEGFYRLIQGTDQDFESDHFKAAKEAYKFLLNIVTTPDTNKDFMDYSRFTPVVYDRIVSEGKTEKAITFMEGRAQQTSFASAASSERLKVIGNETDKTLAMQVLTLKGIGYQKYAQMSLNVSFLDFEKYTEIMNDQGLSPITSTLGQVLTNTLQARRYMDDGLAKDSTAITPTNSMTIYAGVSAILSLEAETIDQKDNFANLFKFGSSIGKAPKDRLALSPVGTVAKSSAGISYWALDNATMASNILNIAAARYIYLALAEPLKPIMAKMAKSLLDGVIATEAKDAAGIAKAEKDITELSAVLLKQLQEANKDGALVSKETEAQDPRFSLASQVGTIVDMNRGLAMITNMLLQGQGKTPEEQKAIQQAAAKYVETTRIIGEAMPLIGSAQLATKAALALAIENRKKELAGQDPQKDRTLILLSAEANVANQVYRAASKNETDYGLIMSSVKFLSDLTRMTNPEYNR
jgi:hypothetical protein